MEMLRKIIFKKNDQRKQKITTTSNIKVQIYVLNKEIYRGKYIFGFLEVRGMSVQEEEEGKI